MPIDKQTFSFVLRAQTHRHTDSYLPMADGFGFAPSAPFSHNASISSKFTCFWQRKIFLLFVYLFLLVLLLLFLKFCTWLN